MLSAGYAHSPAKGDAAECQEPAQCLQGRTVSLRETVLSHAGEPHDAAGSIAIPLHFSSSQFKGRCQLNWEQHMKGRNGKQETFVSEQRGLLSANPDKTA